MPHAHLGGTCSATVSRGAASMRLSRWGWSSNSGQKDTNLATITSWVQDFASSLVACRAWTYGEFIGELRRACNTFEGGFSDWGIPRVCHSKEDFEELRHWRTLRTRLWKETVAHLTKTPSEMAVLLGFSARLILMNSTGGEVEFHSNQFSYMFESSRLQE